MSKGDDEPVNQKEREVLFSNEAFLIGVLQAVSGGSLFAALAQSATILKHSGFVPFLLFLTFMGFALICAVWAAYWRHQYKLLDIKGAPRVAVTRTISKSYVTAKKLKPICHACASACCSLYWQLALPSSIHRSDVDVHASKNNSLHWIVRPLALLGWEEHLIFVFCSPTIKRCAARAVHPCEAREPQSGKNFDLKASSE
jgi:hypothetical protein